MQPKGREALPFCPVEQRCGACQLLSVPYERQLADKQARIATLFDELADESCVLHPILGMEHPFHYRDKVISPYAPGKRLARASHAAYGKDGRRPKGRERSARTAREARYAAHEREILCGMYAAGTHRIVPTDECLIENEVAKRVVLAIRDLMPAFGIEPYDEDAGSGFLRHAVVRVGHESGEVLVTLVTNDQLFPGSKAFVRELRRRCPEITTIVQNVNTRQTNVILGEREVRLFGPGFILDTLCGLSFRISSQSFYQVNCTQTEVLYRRAIELARLTGTETVIDAYCGTGTIGLVAARGVDARGAGSGSAGSEPEGTPAGSPVAPPAHAARVIGVDEVASAIRDARANAQHNGIENAEFVVADAGSFMRELAQSAREAGEEHARRDPAAGNAGFIDVVLMDPPRAGASEEFLAALAALAPARVVYISCNPLTQARDVAYLVERGYRLESLQPVDMFPHTEHVENIAVCVRS